MTRSIVGEDGKPLHPNSIESLLEMSNRILEELCLHESDKVLDAGDKFRKAMQLDELRRSCGVEPEPMSIRMWKPTPHVGS